MVIIMVLMMNNGRMMVVILVIMMKNGRMMVMILVSKDGWYYNGK